MLNEEHSTLPYDTHYDGAICVEMEAACVDANRQGLVIRGISDYADSHKKDM